MNTIPCKVPPEYGSRICSIARAIPDRTSVRRLRHLKSRYLANDDLTIAALPAAYRRVMLDRIHSLLAAQEAIAS
jgi:hypothetical protein